MRIDAKCTIFVPKKDENGVYNKGARILSEYLSKMNPDVKLKIEKVDAEGRFVALASDDNAENVCKIAKTIIYPEGNDALSVKNIGGIIFMSGANERGVLYAVYELIETLGAKFFAVDTEYVPDYTGKDIIVPDDTDITKAADFAYRDIYWTNSYDPDLSVKLRINGCLKNQAGYGRTIPKELGGGIEYAGPHFVHTNELMVPASLFDEHPEYFSEINGERTAKHLYSQICMTNDDVLRIVIEKTKEWLRAEPDKKIVSVSQNDSFVIESYCTCEKCRKIIEEEGSPAGPVIRFVNKVAEEIEKEFPDVMVDTLAYQYSMQAPKITKPRKNVCVRLCTGGCYCHPIDTCKKNDFVKKAFEDWNRICDNLYVWDYTTDFQQYLSPEPNLNKIPSDIRFFKSHGVQGTFMQGAYQAGDTAEFAELRCYIMAKMLFNVDEDETVLKREFIENYYGPAAPYITEYQDFIHAKMTDDIHLPVFFICGDFWGPLVSEEESAHLDELFANAENAVKDDPRLLRHVKKTELCHKWANLSFARPKYKFKTGEDCKAETDKLYRECHELGVVLLAEGTNVPNPDLVS